MANDFLPTNPYQSLPMDPTQGNSGPLMNIPGSPSFMPGQGVMQAPPQVGQPDYMSQMQQLIAPYQSMAQRMYSPYAAFNPQSSFVQNHPSLAGHLDNALLMGSMVPQGRTIGENISGVMGAMVGANQFRRNQMLQQEMMPYKMAQPQLQMMDTMAQIQERQSEIPYRQAMEQRAMAQSDYYTRRMQEPNSEQQKMALAAAAAGIKGFNGDFSSISQSDAQRISKAYDDITMRQATAAMGGGLTPGHIVQMQMSSDPTIKTQGDQAARLYTTISSGVAGANESARSNAALPNQTQQRTAADLVKEGQQIVNTSMGAPPKLDTSPEGMFAYMTAHPGKGMQDQRNEYQTQVAQYNQNKSNLNKQLSAWTASGAPQKGMPFDPNVDWTKLKSNGPTSGGQSTAPSQPSKPPGW